MKDVIILNIHRILVLLCGLKNLFKGVLFISFLNNENSTRTSCNGCEFLNMGELEQNKFKLRTGYISHHYCLKYKKLLNHTPYREPYIYPYKNCELVDWSEIKNGKSL